jgi:5,6,7,8-tetrahydromethanopterin hydro-lyase
MFGPAQKAVGMAALDSVAEGVIPKAEAENPLIVAGVFIHWDAKDNDKIYNYNYEATKIAIHAPCASQDRRGPARKDKLTHPFYK